MTGTLAPTPSGHAHLASGRRVWRHVGPWVPLLTLAILLVDAMEWGLSPASAVRGVLAIVMLHVLPGMILWRVVRPREGCWFEDIVIGGAVGSVVAIAAQTAAGGLRLPWLTWVIPIVIGAAPLVIPGVRRRVINRCTRPLPMYWGPGVATVSMVLLSPLQEFYRIVPLGWTEGFRTTYVDLPFNLGLAAELAHRGPGAMPHVVGEGLNYHWFSHAWVAHVSQTGMTGLDEVLYRIMPVVIGIGVVAAIAVVALRISQQPWVGLLAAAIAIISSDLGLFGVSGGVSALNPLSPTLGLSSLMLLGLIGTLVVRWSGEVGAMAALLVAAMGFAAAGAKGSALPVVLAGVALAAVLARTDRRLRRMIVLDLMILASGLLVALRVLFRGETHSLVFDPETALRAVSSVGGVFDAEASGAGALAVAAVLVVVWSVGRGAGYLGIFVASERRRDPVVLMLVGAGIAGTAAVLFLSHPGKSQLYFLRNAVPAFSIGAALGFENLHRRLASDWGTVVVVGLSTALMVLLLISRLLSGTGPAAGLWRLGFVSAALTVGVVVASALVGSAARLWVAVGTVAVALTAVTIMPTLAQVTLESAPQPQGPASAEDRDTFAAEQITAARWLRDHSHVDDLVATNRHCVSPPSWQRCDSRRFYVAAYTERRVLVEGWAYTSTWAASPKVEPHRAYKPFWNPAFLAANDSAFVEPTQERVEWLREQGVRWLYVDKTVAFDPGLAEFVVPRFETKWAWILEVT